MLLPLSTGSISDCRYTMLYELLIGINLTREELVLKSSTCHRWINMMYVNSLDICWAVDWWIKNNQGPENEGIKLHRWYTCTLFHSPAGQTITKKLKPSKKVCELIAPVVHSVYSCIVFTPSSLASSLPPSASPPLSPAIISESLQPLGGVCTSVYLFWTQRWGPASLPPQLEMAFLWLVQLQQVC